MPLHLTKQYLIITGKYWIFLVTKILIRNFQFHIYRTYFLSQHLKAVLINFTLLYNVSAEPVFIAPVRFTALHHIKSYQSASTRTSSHVRSPRRRVSRFFFNYILISILQAVHMWRLYPSHVHFSHRYSELYVHVQKVRFSVRRLHMYIYEWVSVKWTQVKRGHVYGRNAGNTWNGSCNIFIRFLRTNVCFGTFRSCFVIKFIINVVKWHVSSEISAVRGRQCKSRVVN